MNNLRCYYSIGVFYWETSHTRGGRRHEFSDQTALGDHNDRANDGDDDHGGDRRHCDGGWKAA